MNWFQGSSLSLPPRPPPPLTDRIYQSVASLNPFYSPPPTFTQHLYSSVTSFFSPVRTTMDAILALPALSYLVLPAMSSYSTSLNLLFFYLTWSTLLLSNPPLKVEIVGTLAIQLLFYLIPSTFFLLFDSLLPSLAVGMKAQESSGLAARKGSKGPKWWKVVLWSIFNILLSTTLQALIELLFTHVLHIRSALKITTSLPMPWAIVKDIFRGFLFREILQYCSHRYLLHSKSRRYNALNKAHMHWYHAIEAPYSFAAAYDHPLTYLIYRFLPLYIPALVFRFHLLTYMLFMTLVSLDDTFSFSGYTSVPSNFILGGIARRHDAHILSGGKGNFGAWGICDWACGTSVGGDIGDDSKNEAESNGVQGKVDGVMDGLRKRGRTKSKK
ncbi:MAG: hypothetical protein M1834_001776 [Cirrosporium novae-zelandiae]|nr:MAG: hypothetical protein M1834_001776 [Cirrosporium novae-zelandiae]